MFSGPSLRSGGPKVPSPVVQPTIPPLSPSKMVNIAGRRKLGATPTRLDTGTNSECSESNNVFELAGSDEELMPSNKEPKRGNAAGTAAPSKRQRVGGSSSGREPKTSGGAKPAKKGGSGSRGNGGNGGAASVEPAAASATAVAADLDRYNINRPGGHDGIKASELLDRFVDSPEAMAALAGSFTRRREQGPVTGDPQTQSGARFSALVADLDVLAVEHLGGTSGDIIRGVALACPSTMWPADGSAIYLMFGLCNKGSHSISQLATAATQNHTVAALLAFFDVWRSGQMGDAAACAPFAFNYNPFCCMQTFQAAFGGSALTTKLRCDVKRLGLGAALVRLLCLTALAECHVSVAGALSVTSASKSGDTFALETIRAGLGPAALSAFSGGFELADTASKIVISCCHPAVLQTTKSRHHPWVAVNVTEACSNLLALPPAGTPTPELEKAVRLFGTSLDQHSGGAFTLSVQATPTALPAPDPVAEAAAVESTRDQIEERAGASGLLVWPTKLQSDLAAQAGRSTYNSLVSRAKAYLPPGAIASGCAVGATGGGQVVVGTWPNDNTRDGGLLEGNTVWATNTIWAALARGEVAAGFDSAAAVTSKTSDAGSFAMCLNRLCINDHAGQEITGSRSPSEDGTTTGSMAPELLADLGLGEGENAQLLRSVSHGIARETVKAMASRGGARVVWSHGRHGAGEGEHTAWLGADSYTDVSDVVGEYAEQTLGGRFRIGAVGGVRVGVASWNGVGKTLVVTGMLHASYPLAVVRNGDARGASGLSASLHFAGGNTAVILAIASLLGTPLPKSLEESCAGWLLLGDGGVVAGAQSIMGAIGGAAKYTAEERGAEKSTVELKAEGGEGCFCRCHFTVAAALPVGCDRTVQLVVAAQWPPLLLRISLALCSGANRLLSVASPAQSPGPIGPEVDYLAGVARQVVPSRTKVMYRLLDGAISVGRNRSRMFRVGAGALCWHQSFAIRPTLPIHLSPPWPSYFALAAIARGCFK
ncbi:unnamed protein product [Scytosiphon promiscuus]